VTELLGEDNGKYEMVQSSGSVTSSSSVAVEFMVTAESLCQLRVIQRDCAQSSTTAQQHSHHGADSCPPSVDESRPTGSVVTTAR